MSESFAPPRSPARPQTMSRRHQAKRTLQASLQRRIDLVGIVADRLDQLDLIALATSEQIAGLSDPISRGELLAAAAVRSANMLDAVKTAAAEAIGGGVVAKELDDLVGVPVGTFATKRTRTAPNSKRATS